MQEMRFKIFGKKEKKWQIDDLSMMRGLETA
jgi:hypothetical protein